MAQVLLAKEVKAENIVFIDQAQKSDSAMKTIKMKYIHKLDEDPDRFIIQSAKMKIPFGIGNNEKFLKDGDKPKWDISLSFQGEERNKSIQKFREAIESIDKRIIQEGRNNAANWINDDEPDDKSMKKAYKSALKKFKPKTKSSDTFPDNFRINVAWDDEKNQPRSGIEFFDENGAELSWEAIVPGCEAIALFEFNGLWCSTGLGTFGPSVKLIQLQIFRPKKVKGFQIKPDSANCDSEEDSESGAEVAESEEEEDDDESTE